MDVLIDAIIEIHLRNLKNVGLLPPFFNYSEMQKPLICHKIFNLITEGGLDSALDFITQEVFKTFGIKVVINHAEVK